MKSAHTPTPWIFNDGDVLDDSGHKIVLSGFALSTGAPYPQAKFNASLIVKAVNEREGIFEAMKGFDTWFRTFIGEETYNEINCPEMDAFRDALAKAEAE